MTASIVREPAPAKLNLALHVRRRRANGYHDIETLFAFCADGDVLTAESADDLTLEITGPFSGGLSTGEDNLVLKAARMLAEHAAVPCKARLRLEKRLPVASGIGGGSADAAATLRALDRLWRLGRGQAELANLGEKLGADVPACVWSRAARGEGVGEALVPIPLGEFADAPVLLVNPLRTVSTAAVFAGWDGKDRGALAQGIGGAVAGRNDLTIGAIEAAPDVEALLDALTAQRGVRLARMSGSGATCFAIFEDVAARDQAEAALHSEPSARWLMATRLADLSRTDTHSAMADK